MKNVFSSAAVVWCLRKSLILALAPLLIVCGCKKVPKIDFATAPVASISVALNNATAVGPGEKKSLVVALVAPDGSEWRTNGSGVHKVPWSEFKLTSSIVDVNAKGQVSLVRDPRQIHGDFGHVNVTMPNHPELRAEADIPLRFDLHYHEDFSGSKGIDGTNGINGTDGLRGSDAIPDADGHMSSGGNGSDGSDGTNGTDGSPGGSAADVQIYLVPSPQTQHLIQASVSANGNSPAYFLIDPNGGNLSVRADGGQGGSGGKGGRGGRGGDGGTGVPPGSRGRDGNDGHNGADGIHGWGGRISVVYDPEVEPYLKKIVALSSLYGPAPVFIERPLKSLW